MFSHVCKSCSMLTIKDKRQESALFYSSVITLQKQWKTLAKKNIQSVSMLMLQKYSKMFKQSETSSGKLIPTKLCLMYDC